jgi:zinc-binding alcohol dehydrogenase/oxidoreductase
LWYRQLELIGSTMGSHAQFQRALHFIAQGKAKSQVSRMFGFEDLRDALRYLEAGEQIGNVGLSHG